MPICHNKTHRKCVNNIKYVNVWLAKRSMKEILSSLIISDTKKIKSKSTESDIGVNTLHEIHKCLTVPLSARGGRCFLISGRRGQQGQQN